MSHRRWGRDLLSAGLLLLALGAVAGVAWLSRHPESPALARAAGWPVVGPVAARFRAAYLPALAAPAAEPGEPPRWIVVWEEAPPGAAAAGERRARSGRRVAPPPEPLPAPVGEGWARPGGELRAAPDPAAEVREQLGGWTLLPVLERREGWVAVARSGRRLWLELGALSGPEERPLGSAPQPPGPVVPAPPDPARLAEARRLLGPAGREVRLGGYALLTDLPPDELPASLASATAAAEEVYRARTGLAPVGAAAGVIVLFAREEAYRAFQAGEERLAGLPASGHARGGLMALHAEAGDGETTSVLVHEISHLLNLRAIGPALPPWLDEGLAEELAQSAWTPGGGLVAGSYGGRMERGEGRWSATGGYAALAEAARVLASEPGPLLPALLERDWEAFVAGGRAPVSYALAFLFVRFLLEGEEGALAPGFRAFLAAVAGGGPPTPEALRAHLGRDWPALERALRAFVASERERVLGDAYGAPPAGRRRSSSRHAAEPSA